MQAGEVHPAIAAIVGAKHRTWLGAGIDDAAPVRLFRVAHGDCSDGAVLDAPYGFPIPAAVTASEETSAGSSTVHARRIAGVDGHTVGRSSGQVYFDAPIGRAPSDQQGRSCYY